MHTSGIGTESELSHHRINNYFVLSMHLFLATCWRSGSVYWSLGKMDLEVCWVLSFDICEFWSSLILLFLFWSDWLRVNRMKKDSHVRLALLPLGSTLIRMLTKHAWNRVLLGLCVKSHHHLCLLSLYFTLLRLDVIGVASTVFYPLPYLLWCLSSSCFLPLPNTPGLLWSTYWMFTFHLQLHRSPKYDS